MNSATDGIGPLPITDLTHIDLGNIDIILYKYPQPNPNFQNYKKSRFGKNFEKKNSKKNYEKFEKNF